LHLFSDFRDRKYAFHFFFLHDGSFFIGKIMVLFFYLFQWFQKKHNTALFDALEKVKGGMLIFFHQFFL